MPETWTQTESAGTWGMLDYSVRNGWQPVEEVILATSGPFRQAPRRENSTNHRDSPSFSLLDPDENAALSPTEHFFNGLLVFRQHRSYGSGALLPGAMQRR